MTAMALAGVLFPLPGGSLMSKEALRFADTVEQARDTSCGFAVVATLLTHYRGHPVAEESLIESYAPNDTFELSFLQMGAILSDFGYQVGGYRLSFDDLPSALARVGPVIAHLTYPYRHFALVLWATAEWVAIADPAAGVLLLDEAGLAFRWSGAVLAVSGYQSSLTLKEAAAIRRLGRLQWHAARSY